MTDTDLRENHPPAPPRPMVVCLSGSMRFEPEIHQAAVDESLHGRVVVLPLVNMKQPDPRWSAPADRERIKTRLDALHLTKIDLADEVLVVNPGGYIGESTRVEIDYARRHGKPIRYTDPTPVTS